MSGAESALELAMYGTERYVAQYDLESGDPRKAQDARIRISYPSFHGSSSIQRISWVTVPSYRVDRPKRFLRWYDTDLKGPQGNRRDDERRAGALTRSPPGQPVLAARRPTARCPSVRPGRVASTRRAQGAMPTSRAFARKVAPWSIARPVSSCHWCTISCSSV